MLPIEDKKQWTADLRSGKFEQGRTYLCQNNKYCCLGVYEETHGNLELERGLCTKNVKGVGSTCMPSSTLSTMLGGHLQILIDMNDKQGKTFSEIADYIDANL